MSNENIFDSFLGLNQLSGMWDKQVNGLLYNLANNNEFVRSANIGLNTYSVYLERLRKNQEQIAAFMNIPTKKDVANAAKQSIQTEEKIDILEEQIWKLQDSVSAMSKENLEMFEEVVNSVTLMKNEFQKMAQEVAESKKMNDDLQELRKEIEKGLIELEQEKQKKNRKKSRIKI